MTDEKYEINMDDHDLNGLWIEYSDGPNTIREGYSYSEQIQVMLHYGDNLHGYMRILSPTFLTDTLPEHILAVVDGGLL
jgi:hypothetical protein